MNLYCKIKNKYIRKIPQFLVVFSYKLNGVRFGAGFLPKGFPKIYNFGDFNIGDNVRINSGNMYNHTAGTECSFSVEHNAKLKIGNNVGISNVTIYCSKAITIDDNALIGAGATIWDTDFHPLNPTCRYGEYKDNRFVKKEDVVIKNGAFIGANSIILKGVTIGVNSIVGAGSVVTKDIPDNEIWAGNPARFIKKVSYNL